MTDNLTYSIAVRNLQTYLRSLLDDGEDALIFSVPIDGIYGRATRDAITEYQKLRGLNATGVVDKLTWDTLFAQYLSINERNNRRIHPDFFPSAPTNYETSLGEESAFISILQLILDELRIAYSLPIFEKSGIYDGDTSLAVKEFQRIHFLPVTGRVDRRTWNSMSEAYNRYARHTA